MLKDPYKVLIIDDDHNYVKGQNDSAYRKGIELFHIDNWEEAKLELEANPNLYSAIIIDGRGKLKSDSKNEDKKHLNIVLTWFEEQANSNKHYNYIVNSAYIEEFYEFIDFAQKGIKIYNKGTDEDKMYEELSKLIMAFPLNVIKTKFHDIIDIFDDKLLPLNHQETIINLVMALEYKQKINEPFNSMRHILEAMCKYINKINPDFYPDVLIDTKNETPNLTAATFILCGTDAKTPFAKAHSKVMFTSKNGVNRVFSCVVANCQTFSHDNKNESKIPPKYAFETTLYGLMEVLITYKNFALKELNNEN